MTCPRRSKKLDVSDERLFAFRSNISSSVDLAGASGYLNFAEAAIAASDLSKCANADVTCSKWFFDDVGKRLFRRPINADRYDELFAAGSQEGGPTEGARWVLEALLQSPTFLYLDEAVDDKGYLDGWSMASRLSFRLWGTIPDAELLAKAEAGNLATPELGCGLTRVASFQVRIADNDNTLYPWVGLEQGGHRTLSHDSGGAAQAILAQVYTWYAGRVAYLLNRLATTPDVDGRSALDNTLVIWGSELGRAWDDDISNVPFVFAGATDLLRAGRYMKGSVISHNRMLVSACQAMGLKDVQQYGSLDNGAGAIPRLFI